MQGAETPEAVEEGLCALIGEIGHQLPTLDAMRIDAELHGAPRLSPYELFRPKENALSRIIADLFDPSGTHGQGPLFLDALLAACKLPPVSPLGKVDVRREVPTKDKKGRIDIVIKAPAVLLGIENKPWAGQRRDQLSDYHNELKRNKEGRHSALVFISDQEEENSWGKVIRMRYQAADEGLSLHGLLSSVVGSIQAFKARSHVENFIRYIEMTFGNGQVMYYSDKIYTELVQNNFDKGESSHGKAFAAIMLSQAILHAQILKEIAIYPELCQ